MVQRRTRNAYFGISVALLENLVEFESILPTTCLGGSYRSERTPSKDAPSKRERTLASPWAKAFLSCGSGPPPISSVAINEQITLNSLFLSPRKSENFCIASLP
jgi:hypothetical protein